MGAILITFLTYPFTFFEFNTSFSLTSFEFKLRREVLKTFTFYLKDNPLNNIPLTREISKQDTYAQPNQSYELKPSSTYSAGCSVLLRFGLLSMYNQICCRLLCPSQMWSPFYVELAKSPFTNKRDQLFCKVHLWLWVLSLNQCILLARLPPKCYSF